jgi:hypothetical protein
MSTNARTEVPIGLGRQPVHESLEDYRGRFIVSPSDANQQVPEGLVSWHQRS